MSLKDKITEDMKAAMKSGDKIRLETVRSIRALILEFEKSGVDKVMSPDDEMKMLVTATKKRREAMDIYTQNNRPELAEKEAAELAILQEYLPKQLSREEIESRVAAVIAEVGAAGPQDTNKVIPLLMKEMKGKADGKLIQEIVKDRLSKLS
jgi:uncharacterized protein YqeY